MTTIHDLTSLRRILALLLLMPLSLLQTAVNAQGRNTEATRVLRKRTSGIVTQKNGKAWVGVRVTLHSLAWPSMPQAGGDKVEVMTDARGRFRAMLLVGRPYDAWALAGSEDGLHYRATQVLPNVFAGMPLRLREVAESFMRVTVQLDGIAAWRDRLPLRLLVKSVNTHKLVLPLELNENNEARLPPLPGSRAFVTVIASDGSRIGSFTVDTVVKTRARAHARARKAFDAQEKKTTSEALETENANKAAKKLVKPLAPDRQRLDLTPPPFVLIKLTHEKGGKPITFSPIQDPVSFEQIAKTDSRGLAAVPVPPLRRSKGLGIYFFITGGQSAEEIQQSGHAIRKGEHDKWGGAIGGRAILKVDTERDIAKALASGDADLEFKLKRAVRIKGRLLLGKEQGVANRPILHVAAVQDRGLHSRAKFTVLCTRMFHTDKEGRFEIPGRVRGLAFKLAVVLAPQQLALLNPSANRGGLHPLAWFSIGKSTGSKESLDLGDIRLDELEVLDIAVKTPDSSPANRAKLLIAAGKGSADTRQYETYTADRRGRLRMLVPKNVELDIAAGLSGQVRIVHSKKREGLLVIDLRALYLTGRVVNGQGQPLANAHVVVQPLDLGSNALLSSLLLARCQSDDNGKFRLAVQAGSNYFLSCYWFNGKRGYATLPRRVNFDHSTVTDYEIVIGDAPAPDKPEDKSKEAKKK